MLNRVDLKAIACVVMLVLAASQSSMASGSAGRFRLGGFLGAGISKQKDLNETIDDMAKFLHEQVYVDEVVDFDFEDDELGGGPMIGAYAEYLTSFNLGVGAEIIPLSSSGGYNWRYESYYYGFDWRTEADYSAGGNVASIYGIYLLPLRTAPVALRLGGGLGYLFGAKFEIDYNSDVRVFADSDSGEAEQWHDVLETSGSAVAFHGLVGVEYKITSKLLLCANATYRVASVDELEVEDVSRSDSDIFENVEKGETLRWHSDEQTPDFSTKEGDKVGLDFGGLYLTVNVAYEF